MCVTLKNLPCGNALKLQSNYNLEDFIIEWLC